MRKGWRKALLFGGLACFATGLFACGEDSGSELKFRLLDNGTYEVSGYKNSEITEVVIPAEYKGKPVSSIGDKAFYDANEMQRLEIPDGIEHIGAYAFEYCEELKEVSIPDSVVSMGEGAFKSCACLIEITLPEHLTSIPKFGFRDCYDLRTITFPENLKSIGDYSFDHCENLARIAIPEGVETIGIEAFVGCYNATSITIPSTVKTIQRSAFYSCKNATWLTIEEGLEEIGERAFINCEGLTELRLPQSLKRIGADAFSNCKNVENLSFSDEIEYIASTAFSGCEKLPYTTDGEYKYVGNGSNPYFYLASAPKTITTANINEHCKIVGSFAKCENLTSVVIPEGVKTLANEAFSYCERLTSVSLPSTLTTISDSAFNNCKSLTQISLPADLKAIGNSAFYCCTGLKEIPLPDGLKSIGNQAFYYCDSLIELSLPNGIEQVGSNAFPNQVLTAQENGLNFMGNTSNPYLCIVAITDTNGVRIPAACKLLATNVFASANLRNISVDKESTVFESIDGDLYTKGGETLIKYAGGSYHDVDFTIPSSVKEIASGAFSKCNSLTYLRIDKNVERIQAGAFGNIKDLHVYCRAKSRPSGWSEKAFPEEISVYWDNSSYYGSDGKLVIW